ncbi:hypothetical protein [Flavobacterium sp. C3NV]|uniref:hypothetical protein n=1 Tax=Flavobacterium sp. C3NV TaxID=3393358 RepID=UPI00398F969E
MKKSQIAQISGQLLLRFLIFARKENQKGKNKKASDFSEAFIVVSGTGLEAGNEIE